MCVCVCMHKTTFYLSIHLIYGHLDCFHCYLHIDNSILSIFNLFVYIYVHLIYLFPKLPHFFSLKGRNRWLIFEQLLKPSNLKNRVNLNRLMKEAQCQEEVPWIMYSSVYGLTELRLFWKPYKSEWGRR